MILMGLKRGVLKIGSCGYKEVGVQETAEPGEEECGSDRRRDRDRAETCTEGLLVSSGLFRDTVSLKCPVH